MKLKEGLREDCIYLPEKIWNGLGWFIDTQLEIKIRKINDKNAIIITRK
jgi:hypothetical protein